MSDTVLAQPLPAASTRLPAIGIIAALLTMVLWAAGLAITRYGVTGSLTVWDVVFLRGAVPAIVLLPVLWKLGPGFATGRNKSVALVLLGAGLPFMCVSSGGTLFAPAAHAGALMPGSMPLFTAILAWLVLREVVSGSRLIGFGLILVGVIALGGYHLFAGEPGLWRGHLLFLCGAALWATYTLAVRQSGLGPWHAAAIVYVYSAVIFTPVYFFFLEPRIFQVPLYEVALQGGQSIFSGLASMYTYGVAVRSLGPGRAAAFAALVPALAALLAIPLLGEWPEPVTWGGIALIGAGVALASGAFIRQRNQHGH